VMGSPFTITTTDCAAAGRGKSMANAPRARTAHRQRSAGAKVRNAARCLFIAVTFSLWFSCVIPIIPPPPSLAKPCLPSSLGDPDKHAPGVVSGPASTEFWRSCAAGLPLAEAPLAAEIGKIIVLPTACPCPTWTWSRAYASRVTASPCGSILECWCCKCNR